MPPSTGAILHTLGAHDRQAGREWLAPVAVIDGGGGRPDVDAVLSQVADLTILPIMQITDRYQGGARRHGPAARRHRHAQPLAYQQMGA